MLAIAACLINSRRRNIWLTTRLRRRRVPIARRVLHIRGGKPHDDNSRPVHRGRLPAGRGGARLLRASQDHDFATLDKRKGEIRSILDTKEAPEYATRRDLPQTGVETGYTIWADTYDRPPGESDPIEQLEQPVMQRLMDAFPAGPVLDAACGTGRHTE